jgi:hypothetical protein
MADPDPLLGPELCEERPWGGPGNPRRDCLPHRGNWLMRLASVTMACGILSFLLFLPVLVGIPLGIATIDMARRDLKQMDAGSLDPQGRKFTSKALRRAGVGALLNILGLVPIAIILSWVWGWVIFYVVG